MGKKEEEEEEEEEEAEMLKPKFALISSGRSYTDLLYIDTIYFHILVSTQEQKPKSHLY